MKKLILIFLCLPILGIAQFKKTETVTLYWDLVNLPQALQETSNIQDPNFSMKKIALGAIGFEGAKSFLKNNQLNVNYGIDYFQYKLVDKNIFDNYTWSNTTPFGKGGLYYSYFRVSGGVGAKLFVRQNMFSSLNLDGSGYFNHRGQEEEKMRFTTYSINLNLKADFLKPLMIGNYQLKIGYYLVSPKLSSNLIDGDKKIQLEQDYIELDRFYVNLKIIL